MARQKSCSSSSRQSCSSAPSGAPASAAQPVGESAGGLAGVRFSVDPSRQADRVLIENLNIHGLGSFARVKS